MHNRRTGSRTSPAQAAAAAAVGAALLVPLTGAFPGLDESPDDPGAATASPSSEKPLSSPPPSDEPNSPTPTPTDTDTPNGTIKGKSDYVTADGTVKFVRENGTPLNVEIKQPFGCKIEGLQDCALDDSGFLVVAKRFVATPAAATSAMPRPGQRIQFSKDPGIKFKVEVGGDLTVTSKEIKKEDLGPPKINPTPVPTPIPTDDPSQGPSNDPTDRPTRKPKPTEKPRKDPDRDSGPSEDDKSSVPPSSPEDPNSGNGRRSPRVPGQAGDDWAPTGDGGGNPRYNYADPVPQAPGSETPEESDAISADKPGSTSTPTETSAGDANSEDAADMASATGSAWAIGGLVGIAAIAAGLVFFVLGRNRRRRAH